MKHLFLILIISVFGIDSYGQDTSYYMLNKREVLKTDSYEYYKIEEKNLQDTSITVVREYYREGQRRSLWKYSNVDPKGIKDTAITWHKNGLLKSQIIYSVSGKKEGELLTFWENSTLKRKDQYKNDSLIYGKVFNQMGEPIEYFDFMIMPTFLSCKKKQKKSKDDMQCSSYKIQTHILGNVKYPAIARDNGVSGTVYVRYIINEEGFVDNVKLLKGIKGGYALEQEAMRVIKSMPRMIPAKQDGELVSVQFTVPVKFSLR